MKATDELASDSLRSSVSSPGIPKTYLTPSASRHSTKTSEALRSPIAPPYLTEHTHGSAATPRAAACPVQRMRALAVGVTVAVALVLVGPAMAARAHHVA